MQPKGAAAAASVLPQSQPAEHELGPMTQRRALFTKRVIRALPVPRRQLRQMVVATVGLREAAAPAHAAASAPASATAAAGSTQDHEDSDVAHDVSAGGFSAWCYLYYSPMCKANFLQRK